MKRLYAILSALVLVVTVTASPVFRVTKTVRQSDGKMLTVTRSGANHLLYYQTDDGMPVFPNSKGDYCYAEFDANGNVCAGTMVAHESADRTPMEQTAARKLSEAFWTHVAMRHKTRYGVGTPDLASVSCKGNVKVPVILAEFADIAFQPGNDIARFDRHFNATNYKDEGGAGSVRDYFIAQSKGQFRPQFDVVAKVRVSRNHDYYGANSGGDDKNPTVYMAEAVDSATAKGVNFAPYKNSKGEVMVIVIFPGHGEQVSGSEETLWAAYYWSMYHTSKAGIKFTAGLVMDELADYGAGEQFDGIGTLCHEFSHALGLPDFYPTNGQTGIFGMDAWSLMDYGQFNNVSRTPVGYTAYEREFFGWMKIDTLQNKKQLVTLPPLHSDSTIRAYRILNEADPTGNEYYILENREQSDWFMTLYGEGMLINHVHYDKSAWTGKTVNNNRNHQRMTIIPADGALTPYGDGKASAYKGDLWPGLKNNMVLNSNTVPCDTAYVGGYMNIRMNNIHRDGKNNVVFYYQCSGGLSTPSSLKAANIGATGFSLSWGTVSNAEQYVLGLYKGDALQRIDTVGVASMIYTGLETDVTYSIKLIAIANDRLDSPSASLNVTTIGEKKGDVDRNGQVNSADVVAIYNYILIGENSGITKAAADVDGNGNVNSADVVAVYNIIVGG